MTDREWCEARAMPAPPEPGGQDKRDRLAQESGWTRTEGVLPGGLTRTYILEHDAEMQEQLLSLNVGRH